MSEDPQFCARCRRHDQGLGAFLMAFFVITIFAETQLPMGLVLGIAIAAMPLGWWLYGHRDH